MCLVSTASGVALAAILTPAAYSHTMHAVPLLSTSAAISHCALSKSVGQHPTTSTTTFPALDSPILPLSLQNNCQLPNASRVVSQPWLKCSGLFAPTPLNNQYGAARMAGALEVMVFPFPTGWYRVWHLRR